MTNQELKSKQSQALKSIRNFLSHNGRVPSVRELMTSMGYKSPRSVALLVNDLIEKGYLKKGPDGRMRMLRDADDDLENARTVNIPLVGTVTCGLPMLAEENVEGMIPVATNLLRPGSKYFLLRAKGDSMDQKGINDGDFLLVRQQSTAEDGDIVVALIDDEATVKEFKHARNAVVLKPRSSNKRHHPIILTSDFQIQGVVVKTIPNFE